MAGANCDDSDLPISLGLMAGELAVYSMMTGEIDRAMDDMVAIPAYLPGNQPPRKLRRAAPVDPEPSDPEPSVPVAQVCPLPYDDTACAEFVPP